MLQDCVVPNIITLLEIQNPGKKKQMGFSWMCHNSLLVGKMTCDNKNSYEDISSMTVNILTLKRITNSR